MVELMRATFGPPTSRPLPGGFLLAIDIVPIFEGRLVAFRWPGLTRAGLDEVPIWLPWDYLEFGEPPARAVPRILSQWTGREDLGQHVNMVDIYSQVQPDKTWHFSLIFTVTIREIPAAVGHVKAVESFSKEEIPESCSWFPRERLQQYLG